jgi:hypothetical protein
VLLIIFFFFFILLTNKHFAFFSGCIPQLPSHKDGFAFMATARGLGLMLALVVVLMSCLVAADCECGFLTQSSGKNQTRNGTVNGNEQLFFTNMMESKFFEMRDISRDGTWRRQQYNVSARAGRGEYGKSFGLDNVYTTARDGDDTDATESDGSNNSNGGDGVGLVVGSTVVDEAIPVAELDSARKDLHYGSYRAGMKLTAVNGTCAAFFWVCDCFASLLC